jgi:nucleoside-diphosphate-sugar epimerase
MAAPAAALSTVVYNVAGFDASAGELADLTRGAFPGAEIAFEPDPRRQAIIDSWPEDVDDSRARRDWGFRPDHDLEAAFARYLLPNIKQRYVRS